MNRLVIASGAGQPRKLGLSRSRRMQGTERTAVEPCSSSSKEGVVLPPSPSGGRELLVVGRVSNPTNDVSNRH